MNPREKATAILICLGAILALLPLSSGKSLLQKPEDLLPSILDEKSTVSVDQVARFIVSEDSTVQLIDLRPRTDFQKMNIPGSVNIPYSEIFTYNLDGIFTNGKSKYVFYSNGDLNSSFALVIANGLNYKNVFVMKGGLNEWFRTVMNSKFTGETISARENALFEVRSRAGKMFTEINSLPDSLKIKFSANQKSALKKLDGGCE
jgi:rhodanese-related sulfurtransferase